MTDNKTEKISIPIIVVGIEKRDQIKLMLPTEALIWLKNNPCEIDFIFEEEIKIGLQGLIDFLITKKEFFNCLDKAIDSVGYPTENSKFIN